MDRERKIGEVLENGFAVIKNNGRAILAQKKYNNQVYEGQFVTWLYDVKTGSTVLGHYFPYGGITKVNEQEAYEYANKDFSLR